MPSRKGTLMSNNKLQQLSYWQFRSLMRSFQPYLLLSVCIGIMVFYIKSRFEEINYETALVMSDPYQIPVIVMIAAAGIYLSISVMLSISRDRISGVMEILFYAPLRIVDYLGSYFQSHIFVYIILAVIFYLNILILQAITNIYSTYRIILYFVVSIPVITCCIGMGTFFACISKNQRNSLVYFFIVSILFLGIQIGSSLVSSAVAAREIVDLVFLRDILERINSNVAFINPIACFISITEGILAHDYKAAGLSVGWLFILSAFWFFISIKAFQRRGVISE